MDAAGGGGCHGEVDFDNDIVTIEIAKIITAKSSIKGKVIFV